MNELCCTAANDVHDDMAHIIVSLYKYKRSNDVVRAQYTTIKKNEYVDDTGPTAVTEHNLLADFNSTHIFLP